MTRMRKRFLETKGLTMEQAEAYATGLCESQRDVMFQLGDLFRYCSARWPDRFQQVFPQWVSPGLIARAGGVCEKYPNEDDRESEATYTVYMQHSGKEDRLERVAASVEAGRTSDEERATKEAPAKRWLLAVDVHYYLHRFWFSGAGVEAAVGVADWIANTAKRLGEKGLTDLVCCFDSRMNHRKELTKDWEHEYKPRPPKDPELGQQLTLVQQLLRDAGWCCVSIDGMEGDDVMASYAKQFPGHVTLLTQDKDARQSLSEKCNMLLDVSWIEDETSGENIPQYKWLSAKDHTETTGITPAQWCDYQTIWGDATDGIKGAVGIGEKGAADLIKQFGTVEKAIEAAKEDESNVAFAEAHAKAKAIIDGKDEDKAAAKAAKACEVLIKAKPRKALIEFEPFVETTRKLVTMRDDLDIPMTTLIQGK